MAGPTQQINKIKGIWQEHLEVARVLRRDVSRAVDKIYASLAAGGQLLIAATGGLRLMRSTLPAEVTGRFLRERQPIRAIALHVNTSAPAEIGNDYVRTRLRPANLRPMSGRATFCWRSLRVATARISCMQLRRLAGARSPSSA